MVAAAERNGRHLMVGHNMRFDPVHRKAKQMLDSGIIGDVITFRTILGNSGPEGWSLEGTWFFDKNKAAMGALSDMGIHKVDLIQYLLGQKVIETTAKVVTLNKRDDNGKLISVDDNSPVHPENVRRRAGHHGGQLDGVWPRVPVHGAVRHQGPDDDLQRAVGPHHHQ